MRKILLINSNTERYPYPVPPVGLSLLSAILNKTYKVEIFDGVFRDAKDLPSVIEHFQPDYVGVSIRNIDDMVIDRPKVFLRKIVEDFILPIKNSTNVPLILGGSGFSIYPVEILKMCDADFGVVGEAEVNFPQLLAALDKGDTEFDIKGVIDRFTKNVDIVYVSNKIHTLEIPFAEIDSKIDFKPYLDKGVYSIQTKRGCYHKCIYCTYPVLEGKTYRKREAIDIADEIAEAHQRLGYITFEFVDSTFNDPPQHAENICREIIKKNIKVRLRTMGINPAHASAELFELMRNAGFAQVDSTPDSASPRMLINMKKNFNIEQLKKTAELLRYNDMPTMWFFLFGGPGEDESTVMETFEFISNHISPLDMVHMSLGLRVYRGTELYNIGLKENRYTISESLLDPPYFYISDQISKEILKELLQNYSKKYMNCILSSESTPPPEMMKEAVEIRVKEQLNEPIFRTLLRIRKSWMESGKM
ncbi:MAG: radical SAM protein [Bacteroidota bacterium]